MSYPYDPNNRPQNGYNPNQNMPGNGYVRNNMSNGGPNPNMPPRPQNGYNPNPQPYQPQYATGAAPAKKTNNATVAIIVIGIVVIIAIIGAIVAYAIHKNTDDITTTTASETIIVINFDYDKFEREFSTIAEDYFDDGRIPDDKRLTVLEKEYNYIVKENKTYNYFSDIKKDETNNTIICKFDGGTYYHDIYGENSRVENDNGERVTPRMSSRDSEDSDSDESDSETNSFADSLVGNTYIDVNDIIGSFGEVSMQLEFKEDHKVSYSYGDEENEEKGDTTYSVDGDAVNVSFSVEGMDLDYTITEKDNSKMLDYNCHIHYKERTDVTDLNNEGLFMLSSDISHDDLKTDFYGDFNDTSWISKYIGLENQDEDESVLDLDFDENGVKGVVTIDDIQYDVSGYTLTDYAAYFYASEAGPDIAVIVERYNGKTYGYSFYYGNENDSTQVKSEELVENK